MLELKYIIFGMNFNDFQLSVFKMFLRKEAQEIHKKFRLWVFYTKKEIPQI